MTLYDEAIVAARRALLDVEESAAEDIAAAYAPVAVRLGRRTAALARHVATARKAGVNITPAWLARQALTIDLLDGLRHDVAEFAGAATRRIQATQRAAARRAEIDAEDLAAAAIGPGPPGGTGYLRAQFPPIPEALIDRLAGDSVTGTPIGLLMLELAPDAVRATRDALAEAAVAGGKPDAITEAAKRTAEQPATRAATIARTEIMSAYRQATDIAYGQSDVVEGWTWYATPGSERTCPVCLVMHGTDHPLDEPLTSHPACRCSQLPRVVSWTDLGFAGVPDRREHIETGEEAFARLSRAQQLVVVGPGRLELLETGKIRLADLVVRTESRRWGPGRRLASVDELQAV